MHSIKSGRLFLKHSLLTISLLLFSYSVFGLYKIHTPSPSTLFSVNVPTVLGINFPAPAIGFPTRLIIPKLNINASIEYVGTTPQGEMATPSNPDNVGWFEYGPRPGENGSAVIAGHFDDGTGKPGIFINLRQLRPGDQISTQDRSGQATHFTVIQVRTYNTFTSAEVFSNATTPYLNLITCDGAWDPVKKTYSERLVVFSEANPLSR